MSSQPRDNRPAPLNRAVPAEELSALKRAAEVESARSGAHTSEAAHEYNQAVLSGQCQHEANMADQTYRCRIELTGKVLTGAIITYGAFYFSSFRANAACVRRHQLRLPQQGIVIMGGPTAPAKSMTSAVQAKANNTSDDKK